MRDAWNQGQDIRGPRTCQQTLRPVPRKFGQRSGIIGLRIIEGPSWQQQNSRLQDEPEARYWAAKWDTSEVKHEYYYS